MYDYIKKIGKRLGVDMCEFLNEVVCLSLSAKLSFCACLVFSKRVHSTGGGLKVLPLYDSNRGKSDIIEFNLKGRMLNNHFLV